MVSIGCSSDAQRLLQSISKCSSLGIFAPEGGAVFEGLLVGTQNPIAAGYPLRCEGKALGGRRLLGSQACPSRPGPAPGLQRQFFFSDSDAVVGLACSAGTLLQELDLGALLLGPGGTPRLFPQLLQTLKARE